MNTYILLKALAVWLLIILAETLHGILRGLLLVPLTGDLAARQIGVVIGSLIIFAVSYFTIDRIGTTNWQQRLFIGFGWVILTVLFELFLGKVLLGLDWDRILSDYDIGRGGFMLFGLLFMAASPSIAYMLRDRT
ncbi:MAG: hypothetical protein KF855_14745 [Acidobacteria bacterium]|nr:hypothetical protein [Acidobacteriota bacterium]